MRSAEYADVRDLMAPGDVIFFGGKGGISDGIKLFARPATSHVGIVRQVRMADDSAPG